MPSALTTLLYFNIFLCGVCISATLHGLLSNFSKGGIVMPILALFVVVVSGMMLDETIAPYGWICLFSIIVGIVVWSV
jgi:hypothetical protein